MEESGAKKLTYIEKPVEELDAGHQIVLRFIPGTVFFRDGGMAIYRLTRGNENLQSHATSCSGTIVGKNDHRFSLTPDFNKTGPVYYVERMCIRYAYVCIDSIAL